MRTRLAVLLACAHGAVAMLSAPAATAKPALPNSVTCVYDALAPEEREIAQLLLMKGREAGQEPLDSPETLDELEALVESGHNTCLDLYPWNNGQSGNAMGYALFGLMKDALSEGMTILKLPKAPIESYFQANKSALVRSNEPNAAQISAMLTSIKSADWPKDDPDADVSATAYLAMLIAQEKMRRGFASGIFFEPPRARARRRP